MSAGGGPEVGSEFAGHRIEAVLGRGGMGVVYRSRHLALDRERALKVLSPAVSGDERFRERFRRESRMAASIEHPNVIPVHEAGELDGQLYLSMRLVDGDDLRALLLREGALAPQRAAEIVAAVAAGLDAAHATGLVHRDVKPANILVGSGADSGRVYLTDFGISRTARAGETLTTTGEIIGTADFLSPEQIAGDAVDHRADVYALGAVLHYAITGSPPFERDNELATLFAHGNAPRPRPSEIRPGLPAALDAVVARAMAVDPADRFQSAGEFATALDQALAGVETVPLAAKDRTGGPRRGALSLAIAACAVAAAVVAVIVVTGRNDDGDSDGGETPETTEIEGLPESPTGITVGDLRVWVASRNGAAVAGLELAAPTDADARVSEAVPSPTAVAVGAASIWAVSSSENALVKLDPAEGAEPQRIELTGVGPADVAVEGDEAVWLALQGSDEIARYDVASGAIESARVCDEPRAVAVGPKAVWVVCSGDDVLAKVDPVAVRVVGSPVEAGSQPTDVAVGEGYVWVTDNEEGALMRFASGAAGQPATSAGEPVEGLDRPRGVKAGFDAVWVANAGDSTVRRFHPETLQPIGGPIGVGEEPADIALGAGAAWTANEAANSVTRIDAR